MNLDTPRVYSFGVGFVEAFPSADGSACSDADRIMILAMQAGSIRCKFNLTLIIYLLSLH